MMPQQPAVYQNMMNNQQQQNLYNSNPGNPALNRTPSQTPMPMSNQQWTNNPTMNVGRQPQNAHNQVISSFFFISDFLLYLKMMPTDAQQHYVQQQQQQQQQQHYQ